MPGGMRSDRFLRRARLLAGGMAAACAVLPLAPLAAQAVVQSLPPREAAQLNAALRRLATRPTDLDALLSAGNASLALRDVGAAAGFFARAANVAPADARVLLGQARVALEQRRPVAALEGFAQAEKAGVRALDMAADRALAFDLVGDNSAAQALYRSILATGDSAEVRRRLALSLAISGNRQEFERVLYPLLRDEDRSGYRTRAFGLAILGLTDDAVEIADAMMPTDLALRIAPYLRYMPRLTKAQQAAAGNLGAFPAATDIGRDSPDIAGYSAAGARIAARANSSLTPSGAALGPRSAPSGPAGRRRPGSDSGNARAPIPAPSPIPAPMPAPAVRTAQVQAPQPTTGAPAPASSPAPTRSVSGGDEPPISSRTQPARPTLAEAFADLGEVPLVRGTPAPDAVDVARLAAARKAEEARARREAEARAKMKNDADAKAAKAMAEKAAKDAEPARRWVQVGVGRNVDAFRFDWRKLAKQAGGALDGKGPWAAKYGATNRMLAGPYPSEALARAALKRLREKDIDALPYTSAQGEKVAKAD